MLEFLPTSHNYILTLLSVWWAIGQVVASLVSWAFLRNYSCSTDPNFGPGFNCDKSNNSGWRYSYYTLGAMMLFLAAVRYFVLPVGRLSHSPPILSLTVAWYNRWTRVPSFCAQLVMMPRPSRWFTRWLK